MTTSSPSAHQQAPEPNPAGQRPAGQLVSRIKLIALLGSFAFPLLIAAVWLYMVKSSDGELGISARGELIRPAVPLTPFELQERAAGSFDIDALRGIWTMVYAPAGECLEVCETNLYHMRQVRASLAHRMDRVQQVALLDNAGQLSEKLILEHPDLRVLTGDRTVLTSQIRSAEGEMEIVQDAIYLVDPFGNLMMRFAPDLPPKSMLKDIKHLLKVSRIG